MTSTTPIHPPFPTAVAVQLLDLLSNDDRFRSVFHNNPVQALAELGYEPAMRVYANDQTAPQPGQFFGCMATRELASKEEMAASRDALMLQLTGFGNHTVIFSFEPGRIAPPARLSA